MKWLENRFSRAGNPTVSNQPVKPVDPEPGETAPVSMPDPYSDDFDPTVPNLAVLDKPSGDLDFSNGFDPYDTVELHQKPGSEKS